MGCFVWARRSRTPLPHACVANYDCPWGEVTKTPSDPVVPPPLLPLWPQCPPAVLPLGQPGGAQKSPLPSSPSSAPALPLTCSVPRSTMYLWRGPADGEGQPHTRHMPHASSRAPHAAARKASLLCAERNGTPRRKHRTPALDMGGCLIMRTFPPRRRPPRRGSGCAPRAARAARRAGSGT